MYEGGLSYMWYSVSDTAEHGGYVGGDRVVTDETRAEMKKILADIQNGEYARNWIQENRDGRPWFGPRREQELSHQVEAVGKELRKMMPFLDAKEVPEE